MQNKFILFLTLLFTISCQNKEQMKGVSFVGSPYIVTKKDIKPLKALGVNWIVQTPFGFQRYYDTPEVQFKTSNKHFWGETDEGIITTNKLAVEQGIQTLLKPHLWMRKKDNKWRSDIEFSSHEEWDKWFRSYEKFILHYAKLAEQEKIPAFCIGTEFHKPILLQPQYWHRLIKKVRKVYSGKLTYAANWYKEFEDVTFWNELDFIGIQAYFPLSKKNHPTKEELIEGWKSHYIKIKAIADKYNKDVIFTEIGYKSTYDSAIEPWIWPSRNDEMKERIDMQTQVNAYEAFFDVFWDESWFKGVYFWKWFPEHKKSGGENHFGFTPQNKPTEATIKKWFK